MAVLEAVARAVMELEVEVGARRVCFWGERVTKGNDLVPVLKCGSAVMEVQIRAMGAKRQETSFLKDGERVWLIQEEPDGSSLRL